MRRTVDEAIEHVGHLLGGHIVLGLWAMIQSSSDCVLLHLRIHRSRYTAIVLLLYTIAKRRMHQLEVHRSGLSMNSNAS
jgi:hypothetical protein